MARSFMIGMVVPDITNPLFPPDGARCRAGPEHRRLHPRAHRHGQRRRPRSGARSTSCGRAAPTGSCWRPPGGMTSCSTSWPTPASRPCSSTATPPVHRLPYVGADDRTGIAAAVAHLAGPRSPPHRPPGRAPGHIDRPRACLRFPAGGPPATGCPPDRGPVRPCAAYSEDAGADATERLLASATEFTAILAGNDLIALGALRVLATAGLRCPHDVSLVGFNDLPLVDKLTPSLTTVTLPLRAMGALSAQMLLTALDAPRDARPGRPGAARRRAGRPRQHRALPCSTLALTAVDVATAARLTGSVSGSLVLDGSYASSGRSPLRVTGRMRPAGSLVILNSTRPAGPPLGADAVDPVHRRKVQEPPSRAVVLVGGHGFSLSYRRHGRADQAPPGGERRGSRPARCDAHDTGLPPAVVAEDQFHRTRFQCGPTLGGDVARSCSTCPPEPERWPSCPAGRSARWGHRCG